MTQKSNSPGGVPPVEAVIWGMLAPGPYQPRPEEVGPSELEIARARKNKPCRACRGSGAGGPRDSDGNVDSCDSCSGSGVEGGI
jgi:hypothetical protein